MLTPISQLPVDKRVAGVHCVPLTEDNKIVMVWDKEEKFLTTIGGRLEGDEDIDTALTREAMEEAGIILHPQRSLFASYYWDSTDTYTVFYLARVARYHDIPAGFEKTGFVITDFETARQIVATVEGVGVRIQVLNWAEEATRNFR
jgi:8-oxo-dGTP pyrophosphatase MutT (NUDIX family)